MRTRRILLLGMAASLSGFAAEQEHRALAQVELVDPALVVSWNQTINDIGFAEPAAFLKAIRAHAMMHIAMHDALNAVIPLYRQYAYRSHEPGAHPIAAAAQAARDVGVSQYPDQQAKLDSELARWLSTIPDAPHKARGVAVGRQSAAAILAMRVNDGWDYQGTYTFSNEPGAYQTTPPWNGFVLQPGFPYARPFGLRSPDQFRPGPPPRLDSPQYAAAFNEVKDFGRVDSVVRTPDQTLYAVWWLEFAETSVNRLARQLATERRTHLWQAARMFALLNMSLYDGYIAVFDTKYEYNHWLPYTATLARMVRLINTYPTPLEFSIEELGYRDAQRAATLVGVLTYLIQAQKAFNGPSETSRLRQWAKKAKPGDHKALGIRGFGLSGFQYLRMLFRAQTAKPDVHIRGFVSNAVGHAVGDVQALTLLEVAGKRLRWPLLALDNAIWDRLARGSRLE